MTLGQLSSRLSMRKHENGSTSVEFAFIAPVILLLIMGVVDAGTALLKYRHAFQAAASLAEAGSKLSVAEKRSDPPPANPITSAQTKLLDNGFKLVMGEDLQIASATARRVIRSGDKLKPEWTWLHEGEITGVEVAAIDEAEVLSLTRNGESLLVADVTVQHEFLFGLLGRSISLNAHYTAGVPSY